MAHYVTAFYQFMDLSRVPSSTDSSQAPPPTSLSEVPSSTENSLDPSNSRASSVSDLTQKNLDLSGHAGLEEIKRKLQAKAEALQMRGLVILSPEGINSTSSAPSASALAEYQKFILELLNLSCLNFKNSVSDKPPFRKFVIKIREEIVTAGTPELIPDQNDNRHLSPAEWNRILKDEKDFILIDTRNWYEHKIGTFTGAINPNIEKFTDFPEYLEKQNISKNEKLLIFCTGGIRCEKGVLELQRQGYENVYQLEGGILKYLEQFPDEQYQGECFVFDHRVALDQQLQPSLVYGLCPHCGQPSAREIQCKRCDMDTKICETCVEIEWKKETCSKNCAYHFKLHPERKAQHQFVPFELERERNRLGRVQQESANATGLKA